jgi:hypothetical protein
MKVSKLNKDHTQDKFVEDTRHLDPKIGDLVRRIYKPDKGRLGIILSAYEGRWKIQLFDKNFSVVTWYEFDLEVLSGY